MDFIINRISGIYNNLVTSPDSLDNISNISNKSDNKSNIAVGYIDDWSIDDEPYENEFVNRIPYYKMTENVTKYEEIKRKYTNILFYPNGNRMFDLRQYVCALIRHAYWGTNTSHTELRLWGEELFLSKLDKLKDIDVDKYNHALKTYEYNKQFEEETAEIIKQIRLENQNNI